MTKKIYDVEWQDVRFGRSHNGELSRNAQKNRKFHKHQSNRAIRRALKTSVMAALMVEPVIEYTYRAENEFFAFTETSYEYPTTSAWLGDDVEITILSTKQL